MTVHRDCDCQTHEGPHWLHVDALWQASNRRMLAAGNVLGCTTEEILRLRTKEQEMRRRGIIDEDGYSITRPQGFQRT